MDFLIITSSKSRPVNTINYVKSFNGINRDGVFVKKMEHLNYLETEMPETKVLEFGDIINIHNAVTMSKKGTYYTIIFKCDRIIVEADPFGYLPVFYSETSNRMIASSSFGCIREFMEFPEEDPEFYHQMATFFTPLRKTTATKGIYRLEFGSKLEISLEGITQKKIRSYSDFLSSNPQSFKDSIHNVVNCFTNNAKYYYEDNNAIALTGGYDGRSIVAIAHHFKQKFQSFSYGKRGSLDVEVPIGISKKLGMDYRLLSLDDNYVKHRHLDCVEEYIRVSGGLNGFLYPQSLHYVKELSKDFSNILTGYVGSEIIRSSKEPDCEVVPPVVFYYLSGDIKKSYQWLKEKMKGLKQLQLLPEKYSPDDTMSIIDEWHKTLPMQMTAHQKLFAYLYEFCFMNLFGTWVHNGMYYSKMRSPFLDLDFFSLVSKTKVSAFYLDFPEKNMRKRLKSCSFYAYLYKKTWPELGKIPITKGYAPNQLVRPFGSLSVAIAYTKARRMQDPNGLDKLGSISGAVLYVDMLKKKGGFDNELLDSIRERILGNPYSRSHGFMALTKLVTQEIV